MGLAALECKKMMSPFSSVSIDRFILNLEVMRVCIIFWMSLNFSQIGQLTVELAGIERPKCTLGCLLTHLSQWLIGELIVYAGIRRPFIVYRSTFSNNISEAVRPILFILHI